MGIIKKIITDLHF